MLAVDLESTNVERVELICIDAARIVDGFAFTAFPAVIGRSPDADAVIDNHWVSRHHCTIERDAGGFLARDLNSHNGTYLNERPMTESRLRSGDHLTIGMITFLVLLHSDEMPSTVVFVPRNDQSE